MPTTHTDRKEKELSIAVPSEKRACRTFYNLGEWVPKERSLSTKHAALPYTPRLTRKLERDESKTATWLPEQNSSTPPRNVVNDSDEKRLADFIRQCALGRNAKRSAISFKLTISRKNYEFSRTSSFQILP